MSKLNNAKEIEFSKELQAHITPIDGLVWYDLPVHGDARGWFKENWQHEKMVALGLPDFGPVQNNVSFNAAKGVTRGLHAEPWDKYVSLGAGQIMGAWRDMRQDSPTFGQTFTLPMDPSHAIFVPRGVANGFQALQDNTVYMYLVNDHWSANPPEGAYSFVNLADPTNNIDWPIPLDQAEVSDKDRNHPNFDQAVVIKPKKVLITGANGQLGRALQALYPDADLADRNNLDITDTQALANARRWRDYGAIINAAAYTAVDAAETAEGRKDAWATNALALGNLARIATEYGITLVHVSSEYVFDGTIAKHTEDEPFSPLGIYGQSKAAGDIAATTTPRHYVVRTSWVIGDGNNFVKTMISLSERDIKPSVVNDQVGRLTFTDTLAAGIKHLLDTQAQYGTYNLTNEGQPTSWADIAKEVYKLSGKPSSSVTPVTTEEYYAGKEVIAPRPLKSTLDLSKIKATGFTPEDWREKLEQYMKGAE
jgi:dTDP-4-dehydrorhamnose 3,5-epimerase